MNLSLRRLTCLLLLSCMVFFVISACERDIGTINTEALEQLTEDCRIVRHMMGETCIPRNPQRILTLRPDHFANSFALGVEPIGSAFVEGFPFPQDIKNSAGNVKSIGHIYRPNLERILQLEPDLIVSNSAVAGIHKELSRIAPTIVLDNSFPPSSWKEQLKTLAHFLNKEDVAQQLMKDYWQRVNNIQQIMGSRRKRIEVSVVSSTLEAGIWAYGEEHFIGEVLNDIGLQRPESQRASLFYIENISKEKLSVIDGDVLFFVSMGRKQDEETRKKLTEDALWKKLKVVQNNQLHFVGGYWHDSGSILAVNEILNDIEQYLVNIPSSDM